MTSAFTSEQEDSRAAVREFLTDKSPSEAVRRWVDAPEGHDPAVWPQMAVRRPQGLSVPEEYGAVELGTVLAEMGRVLLPGPFLSTAAPAEQLAGGDEEAQQRRLPGPGRARRKGETHLLNGAARAEPAGRVAAAVRGRDTGRAAVEEARGRPPAGGHRRACRTRRGAGRDADLRCGLRRTIDPLPSAHVLARRRRCSCGSRST